jgi:hypothetical protein
MSFSPTPSPLFARSVKGKFLAPNHKLMKRDV